VSETVKNDILSAMDGILLVDKPENWTSFDVVAKIRSLVRSELQKTNPSLKRVKVGHTGTLDPAASGLLVLCIGKATKSVPDMIKHDKTYEVEMTLGSTSTTGDREGIIERCPGVTAPTEEHVQRVLSTFTGEQNQTPPAYSAIKVNGKRAYELARAGKEVHLEPRVIHIHDIELTDYSWPVAHFVCTVSSGTYIRSLVADIGQTLGCGAYMSALRRTKVAEYRVDDAISPVDVTIEAIVHAIR